jgi:hypothetical protein
MCQQELPIAPADRSRCQRQAEGVHAWDDAVPRIETGRSRIPSGGYVQSHGKRLCDRGITWFWPSWVGNRLSQPGSRPDHLSTLSSTQILPETCATVTTNRSFVTESPTDVMDLAKIRLGLSSAVTWKGSPTGLPFIGSK